MYWPERFPRILWSYLICPACGAYRFLTAKRPHFESLLRVFGIRGAYSRSKVIKVCLMTL